MTLIKSKILYLRDKFVLKGKITEISTWKDKGSIPISKNLREAIRDKHAKHRPWISAKKHGNADNVHLIYTKLRRKVARLTRQSKRKFEKDVASKSKSNPKAFWSHIRRRLKTKPGVSLL